MHNAYSLYHRAHTTKACDLLGWIPKIVDFGTNRPNKEISLFQVIGRRLGTHIFVFNYYFFLEKN